MIQFSHYLVNCFTSIMNETTPYCFAQWEQSCTSGPSWPWALRFKVWLPYAADLSWTLYPTAVLTLLCKISLWNDQSHSPVLPSHLPWSVLTLLELKQLWAAGHRCPHWTAVHSHMAVTGRGLTTATSLCVGGHFDCVVGQVITVSSSVREGTSQRCGYGCFPSPWGAGKLAHPARQCYMTLALYSLTASCTRGSWVLRDKSLSSSLS